MKNSAGVFPPRDLSRTCHCTIPYTHAGGLNEKRRWTDEGGSEEEEEERVIENREERASSPSSLWDRLWFHSFGGSGGGTLEDEDTSADQIPS